MGAALVLIAFASAVACTNRGATDGPVTRSSGPLGDGGDDADAAVCVWHLPDGAVWFTCPYTGQSTTCPHPDGCNFCNCDPGGVPTTGCTLRGCDAGRDD